jgi:hypothetical protein
MSNPCTKQLTASERRKLSEFNEKYLKVLNQPSYDIKNSEATGRNNNGLATLECHKAPNRTIPVDINKNFKYVKSKMHKKVEQTKVTITPLMQGVYGGGAKKQKVVLSESDSDSGSDSMSASDIVENPKVIFNAKQNVARNIGSGKKPKAKASKASKPKAKASKAKSGEKWLEIVKRISNEQGCGVKDAISYIKSHNLYTKK